MMFYMSQRVIDLLNSHIFMQPKHNQYGRQESCIFRGDLCVQIVFFHNSFALTNRISCLKYKLGRKQHAA